MDSRVRHIAKSFTWRITATLTTIIITWQISGDWKTGLTVGGWEFFLKMFIYYGHERIWFRINLGLDERERKADEQ